MHMDGSAELGKEQVHLKCCRLVMVKTLLHMQV